MIHLIKGILTKEECKLLTHQFDIDKQTNPSWDNINRVGNAYGFEPSYIFNQYLDKLKSKILEINPNIDDLTNVNAFVREYKNNSYLEKHIDRKDISVTISICLESTINKEWPLWAKIDNQDCSLNMETGDGVLLFNADNIIHWRDSLVCNQNERILQFFLHWKPVTYESKKNKTLL